MDLRQAERAKWRKKLATRSYETKLLGIQLCAQNGRTVSIAGFSGLTVIAGRNGAGKSSTLGAVGRLLRAESSRVPIPLPPKWLAKARGHMRTGDVAWWASTDSQGVVSSLGPSSLKAMYINPWGETQLLLKVIEDDDAPDDLLEGLDVSFFSDEALSLANFLLGRRYEHVGVYEIVAFNPDDIAEPYFVARYQGVDYDMRSMGSGELSALYLIWRIVQISSGSVVLLEEPESHLATYSQRYLVDVLIWMASVRGVQIIASTHSPSLISGIGGERISLIESLPRVSARGGMRTREVQEILGMLHENSLLVVVEDRVARILLGELLLKFRKDVASRASIRFVQNGESAVARVASELSDSPPGGPVEVAYVYDGDQRDKVDASELFLPGNAPPEDVLRGLFDTWRALADRPSITADDSSEARLLDALTSYDGGDKHDWIEHASAAVSGGMHALISLGIVLMESDADLGPQIHDLMGRISAVADL